MRLKVRLNSKMSIALFFLDKFSPLFIGVSKDSPHAIENAIEKMFFSRIIAFYFCTRKFETAMAVDFQVFIDILLLSSRTYINYIVY